MQEREFVEAVLQNGHVPYKISTSDTLDTSPGDVFLSSQSPSHHHRAASKKISSRTISGMYLGGRGGGYDRGKRGYRTLANRTKIRVDIF